MDTTTKGASLYVLNIPGVGVIEARLNPSQALRFVSSIEQQLDQKIPRSLRIAPATLGEIDTREALLHAREALDKALNNSVTGGTIADAISVLDRVLAIPRHPPLEPEPAAYDCVNAVGLRYLRRKPPTDGNRFIPLYKAKVRS